ncbi:MAG: hypothetical protein Dasosvirus4_31 [Dasosvirus sp.]|uniref:Uncharacterized protein n=1 Tax=Dasosvirus sp. TaxID=2487764 RepID=A0A3G4ZRH5_9VIRU|nr:MAG: hypothetical protein Dasosvirus4_31 [Dasosvirus sp.]
MSTQFTLKFSIAGKVTELKPVITVTGTTNNAQSQSQSQSMITINDISSEYTPTLQNSGIKLFLASSTKESKISDRESKILFLFTKTQPLRYGEKGFLDFDQIDTATQNNKYVEMIYQIIQYGDKTFEIMLDLLTGTLSGSFWDREKYFQDLSENVISYLKCNPNIRVCNIDCFQHFNESGKHFPNCKSFLEIQIGMFGPFDMIRFLVNSGAITSYRLTKLCIERFRPDVLELFLTKDLETRKYITGLEQVPSTETDRDVLGFACQQYIPPEKETDENVTNHKRIVSDILFAIGNDVNNVVRGDIPPIFFSKSLYLTKMLVQRRADVNRLITKQNRYLCSYLAHLMEIYDAERRKIVIWLLQKTGARYVYLDTKTKEFQNKMLAVEYTQDKEIGELLERVKAMDKGSVEELIKKANL